MGRFLDDEPIQTASFPQDAPPIARKGRFIDNDPNDASVEQPKKQGMIQTLLSRLTNKETRPLGLTGGAGVLMSAFGKKEEDLFPIIGQAVGVRAGLPGATAGAVVGEGAKQLLAPLRGEKGSLKDVATTGAVTAAVEGVTRGTGKLLFRRQIANKQLQELGKKLGEMKDAMRTNPNLRAASKPILDSLENAYNSLPDPLRKGKVPTNIRRWIEHMKKNPDLSAKDLISMEKSLGDAAEFGVYKKGVFQPAIDIPNPEANAIAKAGRTQVSGVVDDLAEKSGQKGFKQTSQRISKLLKKLPANDPTKSGEGFGTRLVTSGVVGGVTQNPLIGAATYLGIKFLQSPETRNAAFKIVDSAPAKAIGNAARLSLSEYARRNVKSDDR